MYKLIGSCLGLGHVLKVIVKSRDHWYVIFDTWFEESRVDIRDTDREITIRVNAVAKLRNIRI